MFSYNHTTESKYTHRSRFDMPPEQQLKILVIDHSPSFADTVCSLFTRVGYRSRAAYDVTEGMEIAEVMLPDLIFCDTGLPRDAGYQFARRIKSQDATRHINLVALAGYSDERIKPLVYELGYDFYISKPIQSSILQEILQKVQTRKNGRSKKSRA